LQDVQEISNIHVENKPQPKQNEKGKYKAKSNFLIEATQLEYVDVMTLVNAKCEEYLKLLELIILLIILNLF
jgi:hypothetical protein